MTSEPLRLDFGCGPNPRPGFVGVDLIPFPGASLVADLRKRTWVIADPAPVGADRVEPFDGGFRLKDSVVDEGNASHFLEHLTNLGDRWERVNFLNELYRVLKPGGKCSLVFPHWCSNRYYGDPTHKEPFSEMGFYYLSREWRKAQAPHTDAEHNPNGYSCDFEASWAYALHGDVAVRSAEYQQHAMAFYKEAAQDIMATLTARK